MQWQSAMWSSAFPASHQTSVSVVSLWIRGKPICQTVLEGKQREKPLQQTWLSNQIPKTRLKKDNAKRSGDETEYDTMIVFVNLTDLNPLISNIM